MTLPKYATHVVLALLMVGSGVCCDRPSAKEHAQKDAECRGSDDCKTFGRCKYRKMHGRSGRWGCFPGSDADCAQSAHCRQHGQCHKNIQLQCVAESNEDCQRSEGCKKKGRCKREGAVCVK